MTETASALSLEQSEQPATDRYMGGELIGINNRGEYIRARRPFVDCMVIDSRKVKFGDDAITFVETDMGFILGSTITDVASDVRIGSKQDEIAYRRGMSRFDDVYEPLFSLERRIRLSLRNENPRPAVTMLFAIDPDGKLLKTRFFESYTEDPLLLNFSYVNFVLREGTHGQAKKLKRLAKLVKKIYPDNHENGTVTVDSIVGSVNRFARQQAGEMFFRRQVPAIYLNKTGGAEDARHTYSCDPGQEILTPITSPLRSFADLINQRQLKAVINGLPPEAWPYDINDIKTACDHLNELQSAPDARDLVTVENVSGGGSK